MRTLRTPLPEKQSMLLATFAGLFLFLFSSEFIFFAGIAHTPPQWFWVSLLAAAIILKRPLLSAVVLGLVLASRQTAVAYAPLMAIYWLRTSCSLRTVAKLSVVAGCTCLLICGPFFVLNPQGFIVTPGVGNEAERRVLREYEQVLPEISITDPMWQTACELADLGWRHGKRFPVSDLLIAACAWEQGLELVHADQHFDELVRLRGGVFQAVAQSDGELSVHTHRPPRFARSLTSFELLSTVSLMRR